ncbi:MAG TPA: DUF2182 domain-containing protein [Streptosporangiaceae bacterium]|nr:DUF2182 domain-containing protein [Streptosporangiaceae bacterium]
MITTSSRSQGAGRASVRTAFLLACSAGAWAVTIVWARSLGNGPGTMGLGAPEFVGMWTVMMSAMMLPTTISAAPNNSSGHSMSRYAAGLIAFSVGYIAVWAAVGLPAFVLAWWGGRLVAAHPAGAIAAAVGLFAVCGTYQLSPIKMRALRRCHVAEAQNDLPGTSINGVPMARGIRYGRTCVRCSWALMALLIAFGVMQLWAMPALSGLVILERRWPTTTAARVIGVVALAFGIAVAFDPALAQGLHAPTGMHM